MHPLRKYPLRPLSFNGYVWEKNLILKYNYIHMFCNENGLKQKILKDKKNSVCSCLLAYRWNHKYGNQKSGFPFQAWEQKFYGNMFSLLLFPHLAWVPPFWHFLTFQCSFSVLLKGVNAIKVWADAIKVWANAIRIQDQHKNICKHCWMKLKLRIVDTKYVYFNTISKHL